VSATAAPDRLNPVVRLAVEADYPRIGELTVTAYLGDGVSGPDYRAELSDVAGRAGQADLFVAELDRVVVGSVAFVRHGSPFAEITTGPEEAAFRMLAVSPEARGLGAGELLVRACLDRARAVGCTRVVISTGPLMHAAHRLYVRLGFQREPSRDWSPKPGVDLICYQLPV